jgi:hypothetical protein
MPKDCWVQSSRQPWFDAFIPAGTQLAISTIASTQQK